MNPETPSANPIPANGGSGIEILRRLLFVGGILCATWLIACVGEPLWRVKDVRFDELRKSDAERMKDSLGMMSRESGLELDSSLNKAANQSLDAFIADKTKGRLLRVEGAAWRTFFGDVEATLAGKSTVFQAGLSRDTGTSYLYFPATTPPLPELAPHINKSHGFSYLTFQENDRPRYLEVLFQSPKEAMRYAPAALVYPGRRHAVWVFLAAVLAYALLPWPEYGPRTLNYNRNRSVVVPDLLGAFMTAFFFVMPVFVIAGNFNGPILEGLFDIEGGWIWLTVVMWFFAALFSIVTLCSLWYASFTLELLPQGLRCTTLLGARGCAYADIACVDPAVFALPSWLKTVMFLAGLLSWRLMGTILLGATQENHGIAIRRKDGTRFNVWLDYLDGRNHVFRELRRANVPMSPQLEKQVAEWLAESSGEEEPWPNATRRRSRLGPVLVVLAVAIALGLHFRPSPPLKVIRENPALSYEAMAERARLLEEMNQVKIEMDAAMRRYKEGPPQNRNQELDNFSRLTDRFDELAKKHDALSSDAP